MNNYGLGGLEQLIRVSGKMELCNRILPKLFRTGHRVSLVVSIIIRFFNNMTGFDVFPNDQGYGHHGRLLALPELGIFAS